MKKVYIQPEVKLVNSNMPLIIATSGESYVGDAGETHAGGVDGNEHGDNSTPTIGGTGDDDGFTMGSKNRGNVFYY